MAYTFTPNINLAKPDAGQTNYAGSVNANFDKIDNLFAASGHRHTGVAGDGGTVSMSDISGTLDASKLPAAGTFNSIYFTGSLVNSAVSELLMQVDINAKSQTVYANSMQVNSLVHTLGVNKTISVNSNMSDSGAGKTITMGTGNFNVLNATTVTISNLGTFIDTIYTYQQITLNGTFTPHPPQIKLTVTDYLYGWIWGCYLPHNTKFGTYIAIFRNIYTNDYGVFGTLNLYINGNIYRTYVPDGTTLSVARIAAEFTISDDSMLDVRLGGNINTAGTLYIDGFSIFRMRVGQ